MTTDISRACMGNLLGVFGKKFFTERLKGSAVAVFALQKPGPKKRRAYRSAYLFPEPP